MTDAFSFIPFLPLIAFLINSVIGRKYFINQKSFLAHWVAIIAACASLVLSVAAFFSVLQSGAIKLSLYKWIVSGDFHVSVGFLIDQLTAIMLIVVTSISVLVFIYSIGYMKGDGGYNRFFAYLSLFVFSMLTLVMADNFLLLYFGWEAVGLCSYFLIGFWFEKKSAADAGKKAFIVNRFGDFGFGLGVILIFLSFGALDYVAVFQKATTQALGVYHFFGYSIEAITVICLLLLCGAMGKSAQFPLHVWLPDAMEGPTPVSALIHAATMVTAGVYLVARCNPLFSMSETALSVVAIIGALTAFFAATIGLVQTDIKRVIAYSTLSQLGFMFLGLGVGAYAASIFHLFTHAYFKALLFLGAGSVIHGMNNEMNIFKMGGLKALMPATYWTFLIASLSISGVPFLFAGFFSKDEILWQVYQSGGNGKILWFIGVVTAAMTAFYSFRLVFLTFHGTFRGTEEQKHHLHESPSVMTKPLMILAFGAIVAGWVGIPPFLWEEGNKIGAFLAPVLGHPESHESHSEELFAMTVAIIASFTGILLAYLMYIRSQTLPQTLATKFKRFYQMLLNKYWVDEIYHATIVKPAFWLANAIIYKLYDKTLIEGVVNGLPALIVQSGRNLRLFQTGVTSFYAIVILFGVLAIISAIIFLR
jgi:NADH-quinone oxidoreductase subunit L